LILLVEALLLLIPQPISILGAELICINLLGLWLPLSAVSIFFKDKERYRRAGGRIHRPMIFIANSLVGAVGGATLIEQLTWGIYLVASSCIVLLVMVVFGAWSIMVGIGQAGRTKTIN